MLRIIQAANAIPYSWPCDPSAEFQPGMCGQLKLSGNQIVCGVSDGTAPIGVIDDMKTKAFSSVSIDEVVIAPANGVPGPGGYLITPYDINKELNNPNVTAQSFVSNPVDVVLIPRNGMVTFLAGTRLNYSRVGSGTFDSIRTVVSYSYQIPNIPGDDSTQGSNRITIWNMRMIFITDQYETNQRYPLNAPLFINESGLFTTRQIVADYPSIAICTAPPTLFTLA